jgi:hypothetical protein
MRFNIGFTPGTVIERIMRRRTPTINHAHPPFIENKRCRTKPRAVDDVVNRNAVSVYQTDCVLILSGGVQGRFRKRALAARTVTRRNSTEYVDVEKNVSCALRRRILSVWRI